MFKSYCISAWRTLIRNRVYTLINTLGLALGICACLVIWVIVRYEFSFDREHPYADRIYTINSYEQFMKDEPERLVPAVLASLPDAIKKEIPGIELLATYHILQKDTAMVVEVAKQAEKATGKQAEKASAKQAFYPCQSIVADPEYLKIMGYRWLAGDPQTALLNPSSVVLTESRARQYFGTGPLRGFIGKQLFYQDSLRVNVSGIVRDWSEHTDFPYTDFISFSTIDHSFLRQSLHLDSAESKYFAVASVLVRLAPNASADNARATLKALFKSRVGSHNLFTRIELQALRDVHFSAAGEAAGQAAGQAAGAAAGGDATIRTSQRSTLYALLSIAVFILLLAIINYVNMATAQSLTREKEIGIRKVMGSGRSHLILQLLTETFLLTTLAGLVAVLAVRPVLGAFREFIPQEIKFMPFAPANLLFLTAITIVVTLMAGLYPARMLSAHSPVTSLKGAGAPRGQGKWWLRRGLIVFQFTVSLLFIIGTMVISRQVEFMLHKDLGFKSDAVILFSTGEKRDSINKIKTLETEIRNLPGVAAVSAANMPPAGADRGLSTVRYKAKSNDPIRVETIQADENYIPLYAIRLLAGRNLFPSDTLKEAVINENLSKELGFRKPEEAIGQMLYTWGKNLQIVGVVADFHKYSYKEPIRPLMITGRAATDLAVRLDTKGKSAREARSIISRIEKTWKTMYPHQPFEYDLFDEEIAQMYLKEQTMEGLLDIATGITLFISCIGLFGLTLFTTAQRTREIGIRKVMGAGVKDILVLLGKDFVRLVLVALVVASAGGWYGTHRWLQDYAYRVNIGADIFLLAGGALLLVTLLTVGAQSLKAALANPVKSLRTE